MKAKFQSLKLKILLEVCLNAVFALICCVFVYLLIMYVFRAPILALIEFLGMDVLAMSRVQMQLWYGRVFRSNEELLFGILFATLVIIFLYRGLSKVTGYLQCINQGVDGVTARDALPVILPGELKPLEDKLNQTKQIIARREAEAKEAEQRKNDLVVYLAHDLKTPLTSMIGYLTFLQETSDLAPELAKKYSGIALQKSKRLEELINEFFEITRFNVQDMELHCALLNLTLLLEQLADEMEPIFAEKQLTVVAELGRDIQVCGDSDKLARVFENLLKNAAGYSQAGSEVRLRARAEGERAVVTVENRGATLQGERLRCIFEKFYRVDDARTSQTGGTGLGLAIAKEIIARHGGTIAAESQDGRTCFTVSLTKTS